MDYIPDLFGTGFFAEIIQALLICLFVYVFFAVLNNAAILILTWTETSTILQPNTSDSAETFPQEPNVEYAKTCYPSRNEANGIEFTYSTFLNLRPSNFTNEPNSLRHVFHKGSPPPDAYPLLGPGVFTLGDKNTLRIYMGSSDKWDNYVDIPNIPVGKWFHLVITCKGRNMDVYVNGNVAQRMTLPSVPKINFGDVYAFQSVQNEDTRMIDPEQRYNVVGKADGMISRFNYHSYALSYSEIDSLYREGPSAKIVSASTQIPPYFVDNWWVQN